VTVPDQAADPRGLWLADYDLLTRVADLAHLDIVATEHVLASGYHERIHDLLPGIEEVRAGTPSALPSLACPEPGEGADPVRWFTCRDREEELVDVARRAKQEGGPLDRRAVVFQRPLPYLYLARQVFPDAEVPYQALDALPLAAEPFAAALDLVFAFVMSEGTRGSIVDLLRSPHWQFTVAERPIGLDEAAAADHLLREVKYFGGWDRLASLSDEAGEASSATADAADRRRGTWRRAAPALAAAREAAAARTAAARGRRVARASPAGPRRRARRPRGVARRASPVRRRAAADRRAGRDGPPAHRGADVLAAHRHDRRSAPRLAGGRLRRR
jgi:hypothetical protein